MSHPLLADAPGEKHLLLGNEAIVRGALEAGVGFVSCYPGTPSSEVPDTFYRLSGEGEFYFEYSSNEKVALEVGAGAAMAGVPTLVTMKHVGVNVAADPLMTLAYAGTPGGFVLLNADDPGAHSSQNEQDNRYYCRLGGIPCFEPATAQEAKDMTRRAMELSREWEQPIMLRTTTRVNHLRGPVEFDDKAPTVKRSEFKKDPMRFVSIPAVARKRHVELLKNLEIAREEAEHSPWNVVRGSGAVGVIASGISRAYLADVLAEQGWEDEVTVLELGLTYPLPEKLIADFIGGVKRVVILEELEPVLETEIRALAQSQGIDVEIIGKNDILTRLGEYSTTVVYKALHRVLKGTDAPAMDICPAEEGLPNRPPNLCAGCSHRSVYYAVRQLFGDDAIYSSDIGCYTLGILPPLRCADFLVCMGSSVSGGSGMAKATGKEVVAFIGDSTFFHTGIPGLVNAVFNQHDLILVVLDNQTTAMTGHQPHPGCSEVVIEASPEPRTRLDIESVVRGCGVQEVRKVRSFNQKSLTKTFEELRGMKGVRVVIAEEPCILFARRTLRKAATQVAYVAEQGEDVVACLNNLGCPAFYRDGEDVQIDPGLCSGCMVCLQVSKNIKARKR